MAVAQRRRRGVCGHEESGATRGAADRSRRAGGRGRARWPGPDRPGQRHGARWPRAEPPHPRGSRGPQRGRRRAGAPPIGRRHRPPPRGLRPSPERSLRRRAPLGGDGAGGDRRSGGGVARARGPGVRERDSQARRLSRAPSRRVPDDGGRRRLGNGRRSDCDGKDRRRVPRHRAALPAPLRDGTAQSAGHDRDRPRNPDHRAAPGAGAADRGGVPRPRRPALFRRPDVASRRAQLRGAGGGSAWRRLGWSGNAAARRDQSAALHDGIRRHGPLGAGHGRQPVLHYLYERAAPGRDLHDLRASERGRPRVAVARPGRPDPEHSPVSPRAVRIAVLLGVACGVPRAVAAQFGYFGQNKIQYQSFAWRVLPGEHVDLYFYPEEEELARVALGYAEESYGVLERRFSHAVQHRIPLIIYASHTDFEQTNVLPYAPPEELLGVTDFLKRRVTLPFTGNYADFRHTLRHELVHVFQLSLATEAYLRYPRTARVPLPLWFSEGLAEYFSAGEDSRDEMILRELTVSGQLPQLGQLAYAGGGIIYPIGGSILRYLGTTYGDWRIAALYHELWKYPTLDAAVRELYGRTLAQLSDEWAFWMRRRYFGDVGTTRPLALVAHQLTTLAIKPVAYRLPDDTVVRVLYFSPADGYASIYSRPLEGGSADLVIHGERTPEFESFHYFESRIDVNNAGIAVFGSRFESRDALIFWDLRKGGLVGRYQFQDLVSILSPSWAPDGKSVVFSGL